jgi:Protein of unknown function (DUF3040)
MGAEMEESMPLSPREQQILAGIEQSLGEKDPALANTFAKARLPSSPAHQGVMRWFPLSLVHTGMLVLILTVLVAAHPVAVELGRPWLGLLTALLIVPWLLSAAGTDISTPTTWRHRGRQQRRPADTRNDC